MKQTKYIYRIAQTVEDMEKILNSENTDKLLANVIELHEVFVCYLIVWES